ncbi:MAG: hypothetical protein ACRD10_02890, partial [Terriglobia bacterium]
MENYFNYFTETEESFQRHRGTPTLLSALDWALIEAWKEAGIPLDAVRTGIERTFEKFARRPQRFRKVNGLGYCTQEVLRAAEQSTHAAIESGDLRAARREAAPPFAENEVMKLLDGGAIALEKACGTARADGQPELAEDFSAAAGELKKLALQGSGQLLNDLEKCERSLTVVEDKLTASLTRGSSIELLTQLREEVERGMA